MVANRFRLPRRATWYVLALPALAGVWLLGLALPAAAQFPSVDTTHITSVAQDSVGVVWATGLVPNGPAGIYRWQGDHWEPQSIRPDIPGAWAQSVWPGPRGGVVAVWRSPAKGGTVFAWHGGGKIKILGNIESQTIPANGSGIIIRYFDSPLVTTTSSGEILITGNSPRIYRAEPDGTIRLVYTIQPGQYLPHRRFLNRRASFLPLHAIEDAQGRTWIWSGLPLRAEVSGAMLRGFLLADKKGFDYHAQLPGLPDSQLTCLGRWDKNHLAAGIVDDGLYLIDTATLRARRLTEPEPGAFRFVQQVFDAGNDRYVIASILGPPQTRNTSHREFGVLWRFHNGHWKKLLTGLDEGNNFHYQVTRPRVTTRQGVWIGGWEKGLWFVPFAAGRAVTPQHVNWKHGFPVDTARGLFALHNGSILAADFAPPRTVAVNANSLLASSTPPANIRVIDPFTMFQPDQRRHLWGMLTVGAQALDEWNGEKWTAHPLPGNINPAWLSGLDVDSEGRVWLFPDCRMGPMAVFDPHDGRWADYPSYQAALSTRLSRHVRFLHPGSDRMKPTYGPHSQIVYNGACEGINYFDGNNWHVWNRPAVPGDPGHFFDGAAFFDAAGHVAVNINHKTREWRPDQGWRLIPYEPHSGGIVNFFTPAPPAKPPEGCPSTESSSLARDTLGRFWWTWKGSLYEGVPGLCRKALDANQPQPFIDGRLLRRAITDNRGNIFLETLSANRKIGEYTVLPSSGELPHTTIHLTKLSSDSVSVGFQSSIPGGALFTWKLDGGDWRAPEKQARVVLRSLAGGEHRLEAASINSHLQMDAVPASTVFEIGARTQQQVPALITRLEKAQTDDERKAAIDALARQPASVVLPALKAARAHASDDERWWIDAAIQEVTQHAHQSTPAGQER